MPTKVLIDPWLFSFTDDELPLVMEELEPILAEINDLPRDYPVTLTAFLSNDFVESVISNYRYYYGRNGGTFARLVMNFELQEAPASLPAQVLTQNIPALDECWLRVLADIGSNCNSQFWRSPIILVANLNERQWPNEDEVQYVSKGNRRERNLVQIRKIKNHRFFERDLDPWRLACVGIPVARSESLEQKRSTWKRLPCPPQLTGARSLQDLMEKLQGRYSFTRTDANFYYVPPVDWNPLTVTKQSWREGRGFPREPVPRGPRGGTYGHIDRGGRIWVWHDEESHWDVQFYEGDHINVSHTGKNLSL